MTEILGSDPKVPEIDENEMFDRMDMNKDGKVSFEGLFLFVFLIWCVWNTHALL